MSSSGTSSSIASPLELAITLVKRFESCRLAAYQDSGGKWTIGWGHTGPEVHKGLVWSQEQCDAALERDLAVAAEGVDELSGSVGLTPLQCAALISLVFNLGEGQLKPSMLFQFVRQGQFLQAARQFQRWDHVDGQEERGLLERRLTEAAMFVRGS